MKKYLEYVWVILIVLTVFAFLLGYLKYVSTALVAVLLITTFLKGALVTDYFMGLKDVKLKYRLIPIIWLLVVISLIAVAYYLPV
ncbi:MAG: cytochrome C oxidase subunit IV family protein [Sulfurimonas sp.]|nr:cytochrome C oxidase subunit IV family protein [Sulfurimonas sp.]